MPTARPRNATATTREPSGAPAQRPARWWQDVPAHQGLAARIEPALTLALASVAALNTPSLTRWMAELAAAQQPELASVLPASPLLLAVTWGPVWIALLMGLAASALPVTTGWIAARAGVLLLTCLTMGVLLPDSAVALLIWTLGLAVVYPFLLPANLGRVLVMSTMAALSAPLLTVAFTGSSNSPIQSLVGSSAPLTVHRVMMLLGGMIMIATLSAAASLIRATLHSATNLAAQRGLDAARTSTALTLLAEHDPSTGLPNRARFESAAAPILATANASSAVILVTVNAPASTFESYDTGESVMTAIARRIRAARPADDLIARFSTSEFAILVTTTTQAEAANIARRLISLIQEPVANGATPIRAQAQVGVALGSSGLSSVQELIDAAASAMRTAESPSGWAIFDAQLAEHRTHHHRMQSAVREAVTAGAVQVEHGLIADLTGHLAGPNLLAQGLRDLSPTRARVTPRWPHADGVEVPAARASELAGELGLGTSVALQVVSAALNSIEQRRTQGLTPLPVSVSLDASLAARADLGQDILGMLTGRALPAHLLTIEIPAASIRNTDDLEGPLHTLREAGVGLCLASFGHSGATVGVLRELPWTHVTLDARLTQDLDTYEPVIASIVDLARSVGITTTAMGVAHEVTGLRLRDLGVDALAGPLLDLAVSGSAA